MQNLRSCCEMALMPLTVAPSAEQLYRIQKIKGADQLDRIFSLSSMIKCTTLPASLMSTRTFLTFSLSLHLNPGHFPRFIDSSAPP
jgi:hypothetical protein